MKLLTWNFCISVPAVPSSPLILVVGSTSATLSWNPAKGRWIYWTLNKNIECKIIEFNIEYWTKRKCGTTIFDPTPPQKNQVNRLNQPGVWSEQNYGCLDASDSTTKQWIDSFCERYPLKPAPPLHIRPIVPALVQQWMLFLEYLILCDQNLKWVSQISLPAP